MSGLSNDNLNVRMQRMFKNNNAVPMTVTLVGSQNAKLPVTLADGAGNPIASLTLTEVGGSNDEGNVYLKITSSGIGPAEALDVTGLELRWAP